MNRSLLKVLSLVLVLLLGLAVAGLAEGATEAAPSERIFDLEVKIGAKIYSFSDTIEGLKAQGVRFEEEDLQPGYFYGANNGRIPFKVLIDAYDRDGENPGPTCACGYRLDAADAPAAVLPRGVVLGEANRQMVLEAYGTPIGSYTDHLSYRLCRGYVSVHFYFDGDAEDAPLKRVEMSSAVGTNFGLGVSELAGVAGDNLPDPTEFAFDQFVLDGKFYEGKATVQALLDNGWRLDLGDISKQIEPRVEGGVFVSLTPLTLFNGNGLIHAYIYNDSTAEPCGVTDAVVASVGVNADDGIEIVLADGITNGASFDDVVATYGTNYEEREEEGYTTYAFSMGGSAKTMFNVADGTVVGIEIQTGI